MPKVSVLLPIYKEPKEFVEKSIDSILKQTFQDFVLYIRLDDPNNIALIELINNYIKKDSRINFEINSQNLGLAETLNLMLEEVSTKYIARMDADDISDLNRLQKQFNCMEANEEIDLCGTNIIFINNNGDELYKKGNLPLERKIISRALKYMDVFCHPTFFAKSNVMKKMRYRNLKYAQDYDLVCRLVEAKYCLTNINEYLLWYRSGNVGEKKLLEQRIIASEIQKYYRKKCLMTTNIEEEITKKLDKITSNSVKSYKKACAAYEKGIIDLKKRKYILAIKNIVLSFFYSKYQRRNIFQAIVYRGFIERT